MTTDGHTAYPRAIAEVLGTDVEHARQQLPHQPDRTRSEAVLNSTNTRC
ncbi:hypothetical protein [Chroococcidiopsis sp. CCMEE 29]|nr:hypothetical protein [Chroococcidiopsis sp. CCMEE 29]